ncbi:hypothetical protein [Lentzea albida]|nr:hypothetical protein [Lentzea albida]
MQFAHPPLADGSAAMATIFDGPLLESMVVHAAADFAPVWRGGPTAEQPV